MVVCALISRIPCAFSFYLIIGFEKVEYICKTREENHCEENLVSICSLGPSCTTV